MMAQNSKGLRTVAMSLGWVNYFEMTINMDSSQQQEADGQQPQMKLIAHPSPFPIFPLLLSSQPLT